MSNGNNDAAAPNAHRLLWAGFMAILAAGVGFGVRGGILNDWATQFGFTQTQSGEVTGFGLVGFGIIILFGALLADTIGYGKLMISAFLCHFAGAALCLAATPAYGAEHNQAAAYNLLKWGQIFFSVGNGLAEAVVNPLVATCFPKNRTHYLNILHAGWPAGLVLGSLANYFMEGSVRWEVQWALFLIPVIIYGLMCMGQNFPKSEASTKGVGFGDMLAEFAAPVLLFLLLIHAMVGYVELGTDSWISQITGGIMANPSRGVLLFVYTSALMFALRFVAGPIVHKISPLGLLSLSAILGCLGLNLLSAADSVGLCILAATVYACGKTFLWPTMLGVVSDRFPKGGAITIGAIGGVGMLSAGLLGGPGIGYKQDRFASEYLQEKNPAVYQAYKADKPGKFLFFKEITGLDGSKKGAVLDAPEAKLTPEQKQVKPLLLEANLHGGRMALKWTSLVPATMALCYILLLLYFKAAGGYKAVHIEGTGHAAHDSE
ncbi:MAG TPA: MFS transporter [Verrucomicrobiales bacterium]|nr:MFS transporter [Verrucomicrobiales bacterium]